MINFIYLPDLRLKSRKHDPRVLEMTKLRMRFSLETSVMFLTGHTCFSLARERRHGSSVT